MGRIIIRQHSCHCCHHHGGNGCKSEHWPRKPQWGQDEQGRHRWPDAIRDDVLAAEAVALMEARRINTLLVVDAAGVLVGAVSTNDLMRAKVI